MSVAKRIFRRTTAFLAAFAILLPLCARANGESGEGPEGNFYARVGGGVFLLDLPESSPFIRTNGAEEAVDFLEHYDASYRSGPLVSLEIGGEYEALGRRLVTAASAFRTSHGSRHVSDYSSPAEPWTGVLDSFMNSYCPGKSREECVFTPDAERTLVRLIENDPRISSVGWIGAIDGRALDFGTPNFAWGDPIRITTERDVKFWGGDFVSGISISRDGPGKVSFFAGPSFKRLRQEFDVFAYESNRDSDVNRMTLKEDLEASYYGAVVGVRLEVPFKERWMFRMDGELGGYRLGSEYEGRQRTFLSSGAPAVDVSSDLELSDSSFALSLSIQPSLSVTFFESLTFQAGAGVEYLSRAPVVRYASPGESFKSGVPHAPARIGYSRAFGVLGTVSVTYEF